jgi:hypothetical protein
MSFTVCGCEVVDSSRNIKNIPNHNTTNANFFAGVCAGQSNTTGSNNIFIGVVIHLVLIIFLLGFAPDAVILPDLAILSLVVDLDFLMMDHTMCFLDKILEDLKLQVMTIYSLVDLPVNITLMPVVVIFLWEFVQVGIHREDVVMLD